MMGKKVFEQLDLELQCQMYLCPKCQKKYILHTFIFFSQFFFFYFLTILSLFLRYSALDAEKLLHPETGAFFCETCVKEELREFDNSERYDATAEKNKLMQQQLRPIIEQLSYLQGKQIPE
jgi:transcription initiation factor IIE alpha subunit